MKIIFALDMKVLYIKIKKEYINIVMIKNNVLMKY